MLQDRSPPTTAAGADSLELRTKHQVPFFAEERDGWKGYVEWEVSTSSTVITNQPSLRHSEISGQEKEGRRGSRTI